MSDSTATVLHRLDIVCSPTDAELAQGLLAASWDMGWEELPEPDAVRLRLHHPDHQQLQGIATMLRQALPDAVCTFTETPHRNWALAWREFFTAVLCGDDFVVLAPWMRGEHPYRDRHPIVIDPKMAFGTGHHPTTAMCLEALSSLHRAGRLPQGFRFLDLGTGSGILGIGCALLGGSGIGLDIDPEAYDNCVENIENNAVADRFATYTGGLDALQGLAGDERYDLVLANILAEPLIELAPDLLPRVKEGGVLVLSGLLVIQVEAVTRAYTALGLGAPRVLETGEWAALIWS
ncbi:50S ribosomal protein L11 methyltransferase [Megalodesulfovibrio paquesii]